MKGTPEQITAKKAARIVSTCRAFFPWYEPQIKRQIRAASVGRVKSQSYPRGGKLHRCCTTDSGSAEICRQNVAAKTIY